MCAWIGQSSWPEPRAVKEGPIAIIKNTLRDKGVVGLYSGCTALVVGNAAKAGVRFVTYDYFKGLLADKEVRLAPISHRASRAHGMNPSGQSQCAEILSR